MSDQMSWRTKVGRRLAWGYETASGSQWQRDGLIRQFMPTWTYRHGWLGVFVHLHGGKGYGSSGNPGKD